MEMNDLLNKIPDDEARNKYPWCNDYLSIRKAKKEMVGDKLCKVFHIFAALYSQRAAQITDLDMQKSGVDYKTYDRNIDLKVSIGDYRDDQLKMFECVPVELYQNGKISFSEDKSTTDVLYLNVNLATEKIYFVSVPYDVIKKIVKINTATGSDNLFYMLNSLYIADKRTSDNGSGVFIKLPIKRLFDIPGVLIQEYQLNDCVLKQL